jgi:hypothetical protein
MAVAALESFSVLDLQEFYEKEVGMLRYAAESISNAIPIWI